MENNDLNRNIIRKVRNKIVISNLESEETMKINMRKKVLSIAAVIMVMFAGSFITVNAATNGDLADKVKDTVKVVFMKDGKEENVNKSTYTDKNNHTIERYEYNKNGEEFTLEVDKTNVDEADFKINASSNGEESNITIETNK